MLLASQGLTPRVVGDVWFIAPHSESMKLQEEAFKWQVAQAETEPLLTEWWQIKYGKADEMAKVREAVGPVIYDKGRFSEAIELFSNMSLAKECAEFLTLPAYEVLD